MHLFAARPEGAPAKAGVTAIALAVSRKAVSNRVANISFSFNSFPLEAQPHHFPIFVAQVAIVGL